MAHVHWAFSYYSCPIGWVTPLNSFTSCFSIVICFNSIISIRSYLYQKNTKLNPVHVYSIIPSNKKSDERSSTIGYSYHLEIWGDSREKISSLPLPPKALSRDVALVRDIGVQVRVRVQVSIIIKAFRYMNSISPFRFSIPIYSCPNLEMIVMLKSPMEGEKIHSPLSLFLSFLLHLIFTLHFVLFLWRVEK